MFKVMSQCLPIVSVLHFGPFDPFYFSPLTLYLPTPILQQLSIHILISSTFTSYVMWYYWCSVILFSFPSSPELHTVVPLLQTCSSSEFVHDYACFCVYVYLWIYLPCMREHMQLLCFWSWLTSLNMMSSNCIHLPSNHVSSLWLSNTTISWCVHQL
jgi:hypothetical protein